MGSYTLTSDTYTLLISGGIMRKAYSINSYLLLIYDVDNPFIHIEQLKKLWNISECEFSDRSIKGSLARGVDFKFFS